MYNDLLDHFKHFFLPQNPVNPLVISDQGLSNATESSGSISYQLSMLMSFNLPTWPQFRHFVRPNRCTPIQ